MSACGQSAADDSGLHDVALGERELIAQESLDLPDLGVELVAKTNAEIGSDSITCDMGA